MISNCGWILTWKKQTGLDQSFYLRKIKNRLNEHYAHSPPHPHLLINRRCVFLFVLVKKKKSLFFSFFYFLVLFRPVFLGVPVDMSRARVVFVLDFTSWIYFWSHLLFLDSQTPDLQSPCVCTCCRIRLLGCTRFDLDISTPLRRLPPNS